MLDQSKKTINSRNEHAKIIRCYVYYISFHHNNSNNKNNNNNNMLILPSFHFHQVPASWRKLTTCSPTEHSPPTATRTRLEQGSHDKYPQYRQQPSLICKIYLRTRSDKSQRERMAHVEQLQHFNFHFTFVGSPPQKHEQTRHQCASACLVGGGGQHASFAPGDGRGLT